MLKNHDFTFLSPSRTYFIMRMTHVFTEAQLANKTFVCILENYRQKHRIFFLIQGLGIDNANDGIYN